MNFVEWVILVGLVYFVVGYTLFVTVDAFQRRKYEAFVVIVIGYVLVSIVFPALIQIGEHPRQDLGDTYTYVYRPVGVHVKVGLFAGCIAFGLLAIKFLSRYFEKLTWQEVKRRKELSRQIKLHLALVTGAIIFSVPFYWLITTSLKPDDRVSMFPPDLIPMRQERTTIAGEERKVYLLNRDGEQARVAKMAELENDRWEVRPVAGSSERGDFTVSSADLKPDLRPTALWSNYSDALKFLPPEYNKGLRPLWNTVYVTLLTIVGTILSSSLVAFSFARLRWPGRDLLFVVLLATMMIPPAITMLPVFLIFRWLNWIDTLKPLWVPALFGSAFNVFLLRQFFMTIPNDLEDAAKIDGCSYFTIYWRIMLPLIKPALAALTIYAFMASWNNFMGPLIYISSPENMTLAYALQLFQGSHGGEPAMMMASATLVMLPVLAVFFFTQRYMIQGVTLTGLKG